MKNVSISICPVPLEQRPANEYQELRESWFFSWVTLPLPQYVKKLAWVWGLSWLIVGPVAAASFPPTKKLLPFLLTSEIGASFLLTLVLIRLYLGWTYIRSRLNSPTIFYEESGWYDGQTWVKTPEFLAQDQLIFTYQVHPMFQRLRRTFYGLVGCIAVGGLILIGL
ncbi:MAG: CGLD27 family protein [Microcoleaceae cyanobacterium]